MRSLRSLFAGIGRAARRRDKIGPLGSLFMAPPAAETAKMLVLVASDRIAVICSNCNGVSRVLRVIKHDGRALAACRKKIDGAANDNIIRELFARDLITELEGDAGEQRYDGVVILSDQSMHDELCRNLGNRLRHLLVACVPGLPAKFPGFVTPPDGSCLRETQAVMD